MSDTLTITLFDRKPVAVVKDDWPIVASAADHDGEVEFQANRRFKLMVRQHADGRAVVYGIYSTNWSGEKDRRGGLLVESANQVEAAVMEVAERMDFEPWLAQQCIADLPAEELA